MNEKQKIKGGSCTFLKLEFIGFGGPAAHLHDARGSSGEKNGLKNNIF
jgi:chromate transport protein ChrA